jgi:hypothetical protein
MKHARVLKGTGPAVLAVAAAAVVVATVAVVAAVEIVPSVGETGSGPDGTPRAARRECPPRKFPLAFIDFSCHYHNRNGKMQSVCELRVPS